MLVVDAHEDLAWNILTLQRDYMRSVAQTRALEEGTAAIDFNGESCIGFPEWLEGNVAVVFATLFAAPSTSRLSEMESSTSYDSPEEAYTVYKRQLDFYHKWVAAHPDHLALIQTASDLNGILATWQGPDTAKRKVGLVVLMEGADGVRSPDTLQEWVDGGVRLIGPAWNRTRYTGGTGAPGPFTAEGRALLQEMAKLNVTLDLSHLSNEAVAEAFDLYPGNIVATHANARTLLPSARAPERHLSDETIKGIASRDGVIGIVLANFFVKNGYGQGSDRTEVTLEHVAAHIDHMAQLTGTTRHIGIGSDFDGGFGLSHIPSGFNSVADLHRIGDTLAAKGYADDAIEGILSGNWLRFLHRTLP